MLFASLLIANVGHSSASPWAMLIGAAIEFKRLGTFTEITGYRGGGQRLKPRY